MTDHRTATATAATPSIFSAGALLLSDLLDEAQSKDLLDQINGYPWSTEIGRRVQHYGMRYAYGSHSAARPAPPLPCWATTLADRIQEHFGTTPTQCIVNEYNPGQGIGMHSDAPAFGPVVASVTLGAAWPMRFRQRYNRPYNRAGLPGDEVVTLPVGSALVLTGASRDRWMHGICRNDTRAMPARRVSVTFRTMATT